MAIQQPTSINPLNSPDHSLSHRVFANDSVAPVQSIVVDSGGNVGIGTVEPATKLDVYSSATSGQTDVATIIQHNTNGGNAGPVLAFEGSSDSHSTKWTLGRIKAISPGVGYSSDMLFEVHANPTQNQTTFEAMRIQGNTGNVGIGTTPSDLLHIGTTGNNFLRITGTSRSYKMGLANGNDFSIVDASGGQIFQTMLAGASQIATQFETHIWTNKTDAGSGEYMRIASGGNVGIGTTSPTNLLSLGGNSARTFWMERGTVAATAGFGLTVEAGGATAASTDKTGGNLTFKSGVATGTGTSDIIFQAHPAGVTGTADTTTTEVFRVKGSGSIVVPVTITAVGTTTTQTINKPAGRINIAAAGTTATVNNNLVTANSVIIVVAATADTTARVTSVVPGAGSFVINTVATTSECAFSFLVIS